MLDPKDFLPNYETDLQISSDLIDNEIEVFRDKWGIPHINAKNSKDLFFAQGLTVSQDRLFQMDLDRLRCLGRSSEYLGSKAISNDKLNIKRNFELVAKSDLEKASSKAREMIQCFTKGVNFYMNSLSKLPLEYQLLDKEPETREEWHSILVYKIRNAAE